MPTYTLKYISSCASGGHTRWDIYKNGVVWKRVTVIKDQVLDLNVTRDDVEEILPVLMRDAALSAGATTLAQAKTAIEAKSWRL